MEERVEKLTQSALGYLWVSLERINTFGRIQPRKVATLRTALERAIPWATFRSRLHRCDVNRDLQAAA